MSSDSDQEEFFLKILTACTTVTKDNILEFSWGLEKKYAKKILTTPMLYNAFFNYLFF